MARMGEKINPYDVLVRKRERKRSFGRRRRRWNNDINIGFKESGWQNVQLD